MKRGYRHRVERLWYFRTYIEELALKRPDWEMNPERLIRFYLDGNLDHIVKRDFEEWLISKKISV